MRKMMKRRKFDEQKYNQEEKDENKMRISKQKSTRKGKLQLD